ncbi:MAG: DEAD/DEAH box helicase [Chitinophagales bacterium]|nr:DEAD/DEAH box helicase [Chitinophagales bacterium]
MQLFKTEAQRGVFDIFYDLAPYTEKLYLPTAYIASKDRDGYLAHIRQKALPETIKSFGIPTNAVRDRLFEIIELLQPKELESKFNPKAKRRPEPLDKLLANRELAPSITRYVHRLMDELLQKASEEDYHISWEVDRKVLVKDFLLTIETLPLEPLLYFRKEAEGVRYRLKLSDQEGTFAIQERDVVPVTNHPAWVVVDYHLYRVNEINGNMVKPFQKKEEVHIPEKSVKTYFQKFILKVAAKADIEAEGFEVVQENKLEKCCLQPVQDLFTRQWALAVRMAYPNATFVWNDKRTQSMRLHFDEGDEVTITQSLRDEQAEQKYLKKLQTFGLNPGDTNNYIHPDLADNPYGMIEWIAEQREKLESAGFTIEDAMLNGKAIQLHRSTLDLKAEQRNDWFDLYGQVTVGQYTFPFLSLAKNIREENPIYILPDGNLFIIPQEWMARYKSLFQFAKSSKKELKLAKSQYTLLEEVGLGNEETAVEELPDDFAVSPLLKATLRPYQMQGVRWLAQLYTQELGACLADDMGLGKTLQTIAILLHAKEQKAIRNESEEGDAQGQQLGLFAPADDISTLQPLQSLIVLPASLVFNWESEIKKFAPTLQVYRHTGPKRHKDVRVLARFDVILTTYQTALRDVEILKNLEFEYIVLDESQYIKNKDSKVFKALNELGAHHKISLSGTPIENSLSDLWAQMQFINPGLLGSFNFFQRSFLRPIEKGQDDEKKEQLRKLVAPYLLRRTKEQVAKDLPELTTKVFYSEMTAEQKRLYEREKSAARNYLLENYQAGNPQFRFQVLQSLTKLRQLANHPRMAIEEYAKDSGKFNDVMAHWETILKGGHKALIFSSFVKHLDLYRQNFEAAGQQYAWLTGSQSSKERESAIRSFSNNPDVKSFFISIKAGGAGLNLTAADYVFLLDPWWNPTVEQQAIARAHRIGQEKHVIAIKFISKDTIEEKILKLQDRKAKLAEDIIGDIQKTDFSKGDLEFLFD